MSKTRALIDTNVLIALEDPGQTDPVAAEFSRRCQIGGVSIYIHPATSADFARDRNHVRRSISTSRMDKFPLLASIPLPSKAILEERFGPIRSENDQVDVELIYALALDAVDVLISQDEGLHRRVRGSDLEERVLTVADAVVWLKALQDPRDDGLLLVNDLPAYSLNANDRIFESLRADYPAFAKWWREKCVAKHRDCWVINGEGGSINGLVVRKTESGKAVGLGEDARVLKLCTFKVSPQAQGHRVGELLMRKALWHSQLNGFDAVYLTAFPKHTMLIDLFVRYGFELREELDGGELLIVKPIFRGRLEAPSEGNLAELARTNYPRFSVREPTKLFAIPVQWRYHRQLFPENARLQPTPLFQGISIDGREAGRVTSNTIRKVYVCRAPIKSIRGGDVVFFYQSKEDATLNSQSITTVGVVEQVRRANDDRELSRFTAGRSVYSEADLKALSDTSPHGVTVIDFLHIQHLEPPVPLSKLIQDGVLKSAPQSITQIQRTGLPSLLSSMNFGFEL